MEVLAGGRHSGKSGKPDSSVPLEARNGKTKSTGLVYCALAHILQLYITRLVVSMQAWETLDKTILPIGLQLQAPTLHCTDPCAWCSETLI